MQTILSPIAPPSLNALGSNCPSCGNPPRPWLTSGGVCMRYRIRIAALQDWRDACIGPPYRRICRTSIIYPLAAVDEWERARPRFCNTGAEHVGLAEGTQVGLLACHACGLPIRQWLHPSELAARYGMSASTFGKRRIVGGGPFYGRISPRRIIYWLPDLLRWEATLETPLRRRLAP